MAKDPCCGMEVDEQKAEHKSEHMGTTYCFCSQECKETFEKNPGQYAMGHSEGGHGGHH